MSSQEIQSIGYPQQELDEVTRILEPIEAGIEVTDSVVEDTNEPSRVKKWLVRGAMGAMVVGGAAALASDSLDETKAEVMDAAPWVAGGLIASEALWIGGAAVSLTAAGKRVRVRPGFKANFRNEMSDIADDVLTSKSFKAGLYANTLGAVGTAAVIGTAAVTKLPPETWPGAVGLAGLDIAGTMALRAPIYKGIKDRASSQEKESGKITVRKATLDDMDRLAEIDLTSFESSYGDNLPEKEEVITMLTKRWHNAPGWMFVAEKAGQVEGFVTAFRTNKSAEEFVSWEDSTNNGTLDGVVNPNGKYAYVANLTINRDADVKGAKDMLLANLFAEGIGEGGVEYGYFESRMPGFQEWVVSEGKEYGSPDELSELASEYANLRREDGKRVDWQLRMYEGDGFKLGKPVANAFDDEASLNFGVVCKAAVPGNNVVMRNFSPARKAFAGALRQLAKNPKLLEKVL